MIITCYLWCEQEEKKSVQEPIHISNVYLNHNEHEAVQVNEFNRKRQLIRNRIGLILIWIVVLTVVYYLAPNTDSNELFEPYVVLNVDEGASVNEIKRAYHQLSKIHHPDQGGDPEKFKELVKAYKILTDETATENWRKYGNPDGPRELRLGYAMPQWLFDPKNSMFILCIYTSIFLFPALCWCCCS